MQRKRYTEEQIIVVLKESEAGMKTSEIYRESRGRFSTINTFLANRARIWLKARVTETGE